MKTTRELLLGLLCAVLLCYGCGDDGTVDPDDGNTDPTANVNANDASVHRDATRWEMPHTTDGNVFISHRTSDGLVNYCLEYNLQANHSQWVAYRYDAKLASKAYPNRTDAWSPEPALDAYREHQITTEYFPGYNRGHIIGSAERYYSKQANEQTFYMSNMSPMIGVFNSAYWGCVEDMVRDDWGRPIASGDTLYVVKGGTFKDSNRTIDVHNTLGKTVKMAVPDHYFMAVLWLKSGQLQAIGFWMEHKDYKNMSAKFLSTLARNSACTIDELEERTGLDFFCNLPDAVERAVESRYSPTLWPKL